MTPDHPLNTHISALVDASKLRRLGAAFARFLASLDVAHPAAPQLALAALLLSELEGRGHSCLLLEELAGDPSKMLGWSGDEWAQLCEAAAPLPADAAGWNQLLRQCRAVWAWPSTADAGQPLVLAAQRLYLRRFWRHENVVADAVRQRTQVAAAPLDAAVAGSADGVDPAAVRAWLDRLFDHAVREGGPDWQKIACAMALRGKLAVITGGPGTGKTYTVARLIALLFAMAGPGAASLRVTLAAPTGKAAARLKQSIDSALGDLAGKLPELPLLELAARMGGARTLHSLLGARPDTRSFIHDSANPLAVDVLVVDEASMVDLEMMAALLDALPANARLVLLGDKDQLASVEAGAVLGDLCHDAQAGGYAPATLAYVQAATGQQLPQAFHGAAGPLAQQTVMLRQSRRFGGPIGQLALAVNQGDAEAARAVLRAGSGDGAGIGGVLQWNETPTYDEVLRLALDGRPGAEGGYRPYLQLLQAGPQGAAHEEWVAAVLAQFEAFRLLCAVREGEWGVSGLNEAVAQRLEQAKLVRRRGEWYVGRPVMVTRNDYGTGVYNGDIGLTLPDPDPARSGSLRVYFSDGGKVRSVLATRLRNVETAFAMTVHKSQGSEFLHTVLVLPKEGGGMLARELVYTGITRAREYFTLVTPNPGVLPEAVKQRTERASGLRELIAS